MKETYEGYLYLGRIVDETYWLLFPRKLSLDDLEIDKKVAEAIFWKDATEMVKEDLDMGYIDCACLEDPDLCLSPEKLGGICLDDKLVKFRGKKVRITIEVIKS